MMKNRKTLVFLSIAIVILLAGTFLRSDLIFAENRTSLFYVSTADEFESSSIVRTALVEGVDMPDINRGDLEGYSKKVYLSPDRNLIAVTANSHRHEGGTISYIIDLDGNRISHSQRGSFVAWNPDSKKILLFVSGIEENSGRRIYYLGLDGTYQDSGLPEGVIGADVSSQDGSIVYAKTVSGFDFSNIFIRTSNGADRLIIAGEDSILTWPRWSPDGSKIAFLKTDRFISNRRGELWISDRDGSSAQVISSTLWGYPPIWSPIELKLIFADANNIWEYDANSKVIVKLTNFDSGTAKYPSYSGDGTTIVFSSDASEGRQIWITRSLKSTQLTNDNKNKTYPILIQ